MAHLAENLIELIQEHPTRRKETDIAIVIPWLKKRSKMLATQKEAVLMDLIKHCEHQQNERDDVIIRQGERGDRYRSDDEWSDDVEPRFYVILSGTVSVYIDPRMTGEEDTTGGIKPTSAKKKVVKKEEETKTEGEGNDKEESEKNEEKEGTMTESDPEKKAPEHHKHPKRIKELDRTKFGKMIVQYGPGDSFGEVALIKRDAYRNATIIADEKCDLMLIGEDLYDRSLKSYQEQEFESVGRFIDSHPYFCDMPVKLKKLLEMSLRKESFIFDSVLIRQGDPVIGMMFITNGQANITVEPHKHPKQYPQLWPFEAGIDIYSIEFEFLREPRRQAILRKYEDPSVWETKSEDVVIRRTEGYAAVERRMKERHIDLCSVATGEVIGDTEILMNLSTYLHTIKCTANTDVFILDTKNFERIVGKKNTSTLDLIRGYVKSKLKTRMEMKNGPLIPLLPYLHYKLTEQTLPVEKPLPPLKTSKHLPDKDYQTKHLLHLFKEGKANLVEPIVPGAQYYKELMLQKAKARESIRRTEEPTSTASLRAMKRGGRKQPRSLMAIRESLREMMEAEVINIDTKTSKNKLKRSKKKSRSKASLISEGPMHENIITDSSSNVGGSSARSIKSKSDKSAPTKPINNRADDNNNNINNQPKPEEKTVTQIVAPKKDEIDANQSNNGVTVEDSKRKFKPVLITEMNSSKNVLDLPAIHEEKTQEELQLRSPLLVASPHSQRNEMNAKPKLKIPQNSNEGEKKEEFEVQSDRLEHIETVMGLEKQAEEEQRLILPLLRPQKDKRKVKKKQMPVESAEQNSVPWDTTMKFVNERIQSRLATTSLDDIPVSFDYESSEPTLRLLESRLQAFHLKYGEKTRKTMKLPKLARFDPPREEPELPLPGGKVWVKKRACQFATNKVRVKDHAHTRHHVVHEIPEFDQVKRTKQMLSILTEDVVPKNEMFA